MGELWGSPDAVIGNRRDMVAESERRNEGTVDACRIQQSDSIASHDA